LDDGPPKFPSDFTYPMVLRNHKQRGQSLFDYGALTLYGKPFQTSRLSADFVTLRRSSRTLLYDPITPIPQRLPPIAWYRFRLLPVRSPLLGESLLISVPLATEMFHFARLPACNYEFIARSSRFQTGGSPFGNPRIKARSQLPEAYRSLLRPSSTPTA